MTATPDISEAEAVTADPSATDVAMADPSKADVVTPGPSTIAAAAQDLGTTVAATALQSSTSIETLRKMGAAMARASLRTGREAAYSAK